MIRRFVPDDSPAGRVRQKKDRSRGLVPVSAGIALRPLSGRRAEKGARWQAGAPSNGTSGLLSSPRVIMMDGAEWSDQFCLKWNP